MNLLKPTIAYVWMYVLTEKRYLEHVSSTNNTAIHVDLQYSTYISITRTLTVHDTIVPQLSWRPRGKSPATLRWWPARYLTAWRLHIHT